MSDKPLTQKQYSDEIRSLAKDAYEEYLRQGADTDPGEWISDWIHESIDGHQWIIYTWYNSQVLTFTDNRDAYFEDFGSLEASDYSTAMAQMAYAAMAADFREHINEDDFEEAYEED